MLCRSSIVVGVVFSMFISTACGDLTSSNGPQGAQGAAVALVGNPDIKWQAVHPGIKANTTRAEFLACVEDTPGPIQPRGEPDEIADESLTWGGVTVSASDGYVRDGITHVDLRIEDDELDTETNMTVLIFYVEGDQEGPGLIVGVIPEYPCLVGAAAVRQELHGE